MAPAVSKRRKLEHSSDDEQDDISSFASFGASDDERSDGADAVDVAGVTGHDADDSEGLDDSLEQEEVEEDRELGPEVGTAVQGLNGTNASGPSKVPTSTGTPNAARKRLGEEHVFTSGTFKSNMFKLQVDELLEQVRPRHGKKEAAAESALHKLKTTIDEIPARSPLSVEAAEKVCLEKDKVAIPFPEPRPPREAKYKLEYQGPTNINVVGSYALKTAGRANQVAHIDMVLTMPSGMFQEKDFVNYRYFYKRAYYLACVAAGLKKDHAQQYNIRFTHLHDNRLQPIIAVEPLNKDSQPRWRVNILASVPTDAFPAEKLQLHKSAVRVVNAAATKEGDGGGELSTPFYNSSLRADMLVAPYLKLVHSASRSCEAFRDACLLGSTWLRQRGLGADLHAGGIGNFEWSALMALMLSGGGPKGTPILSPGYTSYQLFKATLQSLAMKDFSTQAFVIGTDQHVPKVMQHGAPIVWDAERSHNILYKMTPWAYKHLRREARTTLTMLGDQQHDGFDATFILRSDGLPYQFDYILQIPVDSKTPVSGHLPCETDAVLYKALQGGLRDRVSHIHMVPPEAPTWDTGFIQPSHGLRGHVIVGLVVNPETVGRTVDHGPSAEETTEAAAFRKFWGEKAELRRFKDGSIHESLVWPAKDGGQSVLEQIIRYVISKHVGEVVEEGMAIFGDGVRRLIPHGSATGPFQALAEAYKQMESDIRGLEGLPLSVRQIMPADAQLRSAALDLPMSGPRPVPADVVVQFEGSGRWPDDLAAIQRTKIAFLLKLSELLQESAPSIVCRIGLERMVPETLNQAFLDLIYDSGAAFRLRIYHDREQTLLERQLKDKTLDPRTKEIAALGLAVHKRQYIKAPVHTQAIARLCSRHPALSGTIRLVKKWFSSHLLANHVADEVVELLVAKTFVQPWPWQTPSSVQTGFLRTLFFLSRWDWRAEPLIVDLSGGGDLKEADLRSITTKFEAWRKIDPVMNRVVLFAASNVDGEGTTWTDGRPAKVVAGRMTALAKAACAEINDKALALEPTSLFSSPLGDFDFVLHISPELIGKRKRKNGKANGAGFKNLEMDVIADPSLAGYDPVSDFRSELETAFGAAVLLFSGGKERPIIAGLWNPQTHERAWKLNLAYSTVPKAAKGGEDVLAEANRQGMLAEMARLGGDMVERIDVNRGS